MPGNRFPGRTLIKARHLSDSAVRLITHLKVVLVSDLRKESVTHLHEQQSHDEAGSLAVTDLPIVKRVGLHHIEKALLSTASLKDR